MNCTTTFSKHKEKSGGKPILYSIFCIFIIIAIPVIFFKLFGISPVKFFYIGNIEDNPIVVHDYLNDFLASYIGILLAYVGSSLTYYALITSNLDRKIDENPRISEIILEYRAKIQRYLWFHLMCILITVVACLVLHFVTSKSNYATTCNFIYILVFLISFLFNLYTTITFWRLCDSISSQCVIIAVKLWESSAQVLNISSPVSGWLESIPFDSLIDLQPKTYHEILTMMDHIDQLLAVHASSSLGNPLALNVIRDVLSYRFNVLNPLITIHHCFKTRKFLSFKYNQCLYTENSWKAFSEWLYRNYLSLNQMRNILHCGIHHNLNITPETHEEIFNNYE